MILKFKTHTERTRRQRSKWTWSTFLSKDTSGIHLQTQNCISRTSAESRQEAIPVEKNTEKHVKLGRMKELWRKTGVLVGLDLPSAGGGTEAGVQSPHRGNCLSQRRNI